MNEKEEKEILPKTGTESEWLLFGEAALSILTGLGLILPESLKKDKKKK